MLHKNRATSQIFPSFPESTNANQINTCQASNAGRFADDAESIYCDLVSVTSMLLLSSAVCLRWSSGTGDFMVHSGTTLWTLKTDIGLYGKARGRQQGLQGALKCTSLTNHLNKKPIAVCKTCRSELLTEMLHLTFEVAQRLVNWDSVKWHYIMTSFGVWTWLECKDLGLTRQWLDPTAVIYHER